MAYPDQRRLLVCLEQKVHQDHLLQFLRDRGCEASADGATNVAVDGCDQQPPGLATLVALVEEWRAAAHVPETVLELGGQRTFLRTET